MHKLPIQFLNKAEEKTDKDKRPLQMNKIEKL